MQAACPTCGIDAASSHRDGCRALWADPVLRAKIEGLRDATSRPLSEVMLVARQYDLLDEADCTRAFDALITGIHVPTWQAKTTSPALARKLASGAPLPEPAIECIACANSHPVGDMYTVSCPESHRVCLDCMARAVSGQVREKKALSCPLCRPPNAWIIHADEAKGLAFVLGARRLFGMGDLVAYADDIGKALALRDMVDGAKCPSPGCPVYVVVAKPLVRWNCTCPGCSRGFCSLCRGPPHYRCDCPDVLRLMNEWLQWRTQRGPAYRAQQANLRQQGEQYRQERARVEEENRALLQAYNILEADERQFEQTCKLCPGCKRKIQKIDGCDIMVCGRDYHGSVQMGGCGTRFGWSSAPPYRSALPARRQVEATVPPPPPINLTRHPEEIRCEGCRKSIVGLRFSCIHCPCFNFCEDCEMAGRDAGGKIHPKEHVFRIFDSAS